MYRDKRRNPSNFSNLKPSLDWDIVEVDVLDASTLKKEEGVKLIKRSDNGARLNIATTSYTPTRNARLIEVCEEMKKITGFEIAGYDDFNAGKKVIAYLKNNDRMQVLDYELDNYMIIGNGHDGLTSFFAGTSTNMLRCQNSFSQIAQAQRIHHRPRHDVKIDELVQQHRQFVEQNTLLVRQMESFAGVEASIELRQMFIRKLFEIEEDREKVLIKNEEPKKVQLLEACIEHESRELGNNLFGLFNGVTKYTSHHAQAKNRSCGNVLGSLAELNRKAFNMCLQLT